MSEPRFVHHKTKSMTLPECLGIDKERSEQMRKAMQKNADKLSEISRASEFVIEALNVSDAAVEGGLNPIELAFIGFQAGKYFTSLLEKVRNISPLDTPIN